MIVLSYYFSMDIILQRERKINGLTEKFTNKPDNLSTKQGTEVPQTLCMDGRTPFCLANGSIGEKCSCKERASAFFVKTSRFFRPNKPICFDDGKFVDKRKKACYTNKINEKVSFSPPLSEGEKAERMEKKKWM